MQMTKTLRKYWHDLYYWGNPQKRVDFAFRCRHVADMIDMERPQDPWNLFRFYLHLSLCRACANYFRISRALKSAAKDMLSRNRTEETDLTKLNADLLKKYGKNEAGRA